jgi:hypothetical protein
VKSLAAAIARQFESARSEFSSLPPLSFPLSPFPLDLSVVGSVVVPQGEDVGDDVVEVLGGEHVGGEAYGTSWSSNVTPVG